jgi:dihydrolipoamide dehydrogenase
VYASFGCKVSVVEMAETLLPGMDVDLGKELARAFAKQKIDVLTGHKYEKCERRTDGATITVTGPQGTRTLDAERVLVAVGRGPDPKDELGLDRLGVERERGFVVVDATMRTSVPNVYAIGDLVGPYLLAHTASDQGLIAVETMAGLPTHPLDPTRVPLCIYCEPEVAAVGLTEAQAREGGRGVKVGKFPFRALGKALAAGHTDGFVKLVVGVKHGEILGVHMIGVGVTDLIAESGLARTLEATTEELIATVHAHPTLAEAVREAALVAEGRGLNV